MEWQEEIAENSNIIGRVKLFYWLTTATKGIQPQQSLPPDALQDEK